MYIYAKLLLGKQSKVLIHLYANFPIQLASIIYVLIKKNAIQKMKLILKGILSQCCYTSFMLCTSYLVAHHQQKYITPRSSF